ncbi:hypothetical protein Btru_010987 [Bulinus truncatus]|nr:hypothetical protein Btru_010987 [Bulinus truncatus]
MSDLLPVEENNNSPSPAVNKNQPNDQTLDLQSQLKKVAKNFLSKQLVADCCVFLALCIPLLVVRCMSDTMKIGFWCQDLSLSLPNKPDTVKASVLMMVSIFGPFFVFAINETHRAITDPRPVVNFFFIHCKAYSIFFFGLVINIIFTEAIKCSSGRLRPNFFDICQPDFSKINCTNKYGHASDLFLMDSPIRRFLVVHARGEDNQISSRPVRYPSDAFTEPVLDAPRHCADVHAYDALMMVHTATGHFEQRANYRLTYGNHEFTKPHKIKIVFFLGIPENGDEQEKIAVENKYYQDTVQGKFTDTYQNLTYKAVMAFRWVAMHCKNAKLILKMDDDVILDVHRFFEEFVYPPPYQQELIFCHMWMMAEVERTGKWGISLREYSQDYYPPYCSGFFVVIMPAIVEDLYLAAKATPFLWLDDVFIYGVVREDMHFVQIINLDEVAFREEHYTDCYKSYGYRCKYYVTVIGKSKKFPDEILTLRADRLKYLESPATAKCPGFMTDPFANSALGEYRIHPVC